MPAPRPPEWYDAVDELHQHAEIHRKATGRRLDTIENNLERNTQMTEQMHHALGEAIPVIMDLKGVGRTASRIGAFLTSKPVLFCFAITAAVVAWVKTGKFEWPTL